MATELATKLATEYLGTELDDATLVACVLRGQSAAFGALYERHADRVYRYLRFRVHDEATARDLTQDVFVAVLHALPNLRQDGLFDHWLMRIAHNRLVNHWRSTARESTFLDIDAAEDDQADEPVPAFVLADPEEPEPRVERRLTWDALRIETSALSALQQEVLALRFAGGCSVHETAEILGRSEAAVKKLQLRALAKLRQRLRVLE